MTTPASRKAPAGATPRWQRLLDWQPQAHPAWQRFAVAIALTLVAVWLRVQLAPAESGGRFITLSLAAALAALYGGFSAGMLSTLLGMVMVNFFLVQPYFSLAFDNPVEAFWLNLWHFITQLVVVGAIWLMQRNNQRLREASESARASQKRFHDTFEHAPAGISHVALDGRLLRVNQTLCRMVGYEAGELLEMRFQDLTHPEDIDPDERFLKQALEGRRDSYTLEKRYIHKNGSTVWAHLNVALIRREAGLPDYFISVVQDITSIKTADQLIRTNERLMRQAQDMAGFVSWEADVSGNRFRALGGSFQRLGLPGNELSGTEMRSLTHPKDRERFAQEWVNAVKGLSTYNSTYRTIIDGKDRWFSVRAEFERDDDGRAIRAFGITQDVTERKRTEYEVRRLNLSLEQRIQERTRDLKAAYDELESYSYAVAHDLRSPLRIINGFAQALDEENPGLDTGSHGYLQRIRDASKKMGLLIDGLLQLSQIGRGEVERQSVSISAIATRLLEELAADSPQRKVSWHIQPDLHAQADPALVEALMQNLLHNAWKYTASTPQAEIRVYARELDGQTLFCVSDNGAGFDMARAEKLFQPFQRLHQPHEFEGLGIGLATAQRIVLRHGGLLKARAAPGEGATFCFTLPQAEATDSFPSGT